MAGSLKTSLGKAMHGSSRTESPPLTSSASLTKANRRIKELEVENKALHTELIELRAAHKQLLTEGSHERFDERRVSLLKAQLIQLERQVLLLNEALGSRSEVILQAQNNIVDIVVTASALKGEGRVGAVTVAKDDLECILESAESARIKLNRNIENISTERLQRPLQFFDQFVRADRSGQPPSLAQVCSGQLDHLNLKHVGKLESKLTTLYKQLLLVKKSLCMILPDHNETNVLKEASRQLLELSVLVPSAPWPALQKPYLGEISVDGVMSQLPAMTRAKAAVAQSTVQGLLRALNYTNHMAKAQISAADEEASFHRAVYNLQCQYVEGLLDAIRQGYSSYEQETNEVLCHPLSEVLKEFADLKETASEEALRKFLISFKQHAVKLEEAVKRLSNTEGETQERGELLSEYGQQYMETLHKLLKQHQETRDSLISELKEVKQEGKNYVQDLKNAYRNKIDTPCDLSPTKDSDHMDSQRDVHNVGRIFDDSANTRTESRESNRDGEDHLSSRSKRGSDKHNSIADRPEWVGIGNTADVTDHQDKATDNGQARSQREKKRNSLRDRPEWVDIGPSSADNCQETEPAVISGRRSEGRVYRDRAPSLQDRPEWVDVTSCSCGAEESSDVHSHTTPGRLSDTGTPHSELDKQPPKARRATKPSKGQDPSSNKLPPGVPQRKLALKSKPKDERTQNAESSRESLETLAKNGGRLSPMTRSESYSKLEGRRSQSSNQYIPGEELGEGSSGRRSRPGSLPRHSHRASLPSDPTLLPSSEPLIPARAIPTAKATSGTPWK